MNLYESIRTNTEDYDKLIDLMKQYWNELETNKEDTNSIKTQEWFKSKGYDLSTAELDEIWDNAAGDFPQDENKPLVIDGIEFNSKDDARQWLDERLKEKHNTYYFDSHDRNILNHLIEKFGNTYFW